MKLCEETRYLFKINSHLFSEFVHFGLRPMENINDFNLCHFRHVNVCPRCQFFKFTNGGRKIGRIHCVCGSKILKINSINFVLAFYFRVRSGRIRFLFRSIIVNRDRHPHLANSSRKIIWPLSFELFPISNISINYTLRSIKTISWFLLIWSYWDYVRHQLSIYLHCTNR